MEDITKYRKWLHENGYKTEFIESTASMLPRISNESIKELLARIHNEAGKFPYVWDVDFGALLLETVAEEITEKEIKKTILENAFWRAQWCASCATAGGEGLARSVHVKEIEEKLKKNT